MQQAESVSVKQTQKAIDLIADWRESFNQPCPQEADVDSLKISRLGLCISLIKEESEEIEEAFLVNDVREFIDGIGDTFWVAIYAILEVNYTPKIAEKIKKIYDETKVLGSPLSEMREDILNLQHYYDLKGGEGDIHKVATMLLTTAHKVASHTLKMMTAHNIDLTQLIEAIYYSNQSKLVGIDELQDVVDYYRGKNVSVHFAPSDRKAGKFIIIRSEDGKILKPENFSSPNLDSIIKNFKNN